MRYNFLFMVSTLWCLITDFDVPRFSSPALQPLKLNNVDEHVLHEIDDALQVDIDKEEILRKVRQDFLMIEISRDALNCAVRSHEMFVDFSGVFESKIES